MLLSLFSNRFSTVEDRFQVPLKQWIQSRSWPTCSHLRWGPFSQLITQLWWLHELHWSSELIIIIIIIYLSLSISIMFFLQNFSLLHVIIIIIIILSEAVLKVYFSRTNIWFLLLFWIYSKKMQASFAHLLACFLDILHKVHKSLAFDSYSG